MGTLQHLTLDDLFAPLTESPSLGGTGPFVINLSSSTVPISLPDASIAVAANASLYQIRCMEDRRVRYRLRLGPFSSELQADAALLVVRNNYPAALTATANGDDLAAIADLQGRAPKKPASAMPTAPERRAPDAAPTFQPLKAGSAALAAPKTASAALKKPALQPLAPPAESSSRNRRIVPTLVEASASPKSVGAVTLPAPSHPLAPHGAPRVVAAPVLQAAHGARPAAVAFELSLEPAFEPKVPARGIELAAGAAPFELSLEPEFEVRTHAPKIAAPSARTPILPLELTLEGQPATAPVVASARESKPVIAALERFLDSPSAKAKAPSNLATPAAAMKPAAAMAPQGVMSVKPIAVEARANTAPGSIAGNDLRWFVVELSTSDHEFDPDAVPNLDIFSVYRLYSVENVTPGKITHALRLGFFAEERAARAVADYLAGHYDAPTVKSASTAERDRFSERRQEARKKVEATGRHAVIEITDERYVRELRLTNVLV